MQAVFELYFELEEVARSTFPPVSFFGFLYNNLLSTQNPVGSKRAKDNGRSLFVILGDLSA